MIKLPMITFVILLTSNIIQAAQSKPHITLQEGVPGIRSLFLFRPETAKPLNEIVDVLLVNESPLTRAEREIIASYVSYLNECKFCCTIHSAIAVHLMDGDAQVLQAVKDDYLTAPISQKLKSLLAIAAKVQKDARTVSDQDVQAARNCGATDIEIHDTVLIAAAFCMYNRYVDGLRTFTPDDPEMYAHRAELVAQLGYVKLNVPSAAKN